MERYHLRFGIIYLYFLHVNFTHLSAVLVNQTSWIGGVDHGIFCIFLEWKDLPQTTLDRQVDTPALCDLFNHKLKILIQGSKKSRKDFMPKNYWNWSLIHWDIVKLLAKSKLKSLPYNHTDHLPTHPPPPPTRNFQSSLNKSIQVLHQHMRYH